MSSQISLIARNVRLQEWADMIHVYSVPSEPLARSN